MQLQTIATKSNQPTKYNVSNGWHRHRIERGAKAGPSHHVLTMKHHKLFIRSLSFKEDRPTTVTIPESLVFRYAHSGPPAANLANTPGLRLAQLFLWQHCNTINILDGRRWSREGRGDEQPRVTSTSLGVYCTLAGWFDT